MQELRVGRSQIDLCQLMLLVHLLIFDIGILTKYFQNIEDHLGLFIRPVFVTNDHRVAIQPSNPTLSLLFELPILNMLMRVTNQRQNVFEPLQRFDRGDIFIRIPLQLKPNDFTETIPAARFQYVQNRHIHNHFFNIVFYISHCITSEFNCGCGRASLLIYSTIPPSSKTLRR